MTTTRNTFYRGIQGGLLVAMLIAAWWVAPASAAPTSCHPASGGRGGYSVEGASAAYGNGDTSVYMAGAVTERIQWWGPANACACPAVQCSFMSESSPPCQVSCGARQSAVCQCATCQGAGGIVSLVGYNSCYCISPPPRGSTGGRSR
jgi:hypothetical protein